jgi:UDP-glucose 4-epimerase
VRCLVLGGGGFIGRHLIEDLLAQGKEVLVYDRPDALRSIAEKFPQVKLIDGEFQNENRWISILNGVNICYHLISTSVPKSSNDDPISDVSGNLIGTLQLLDAARRNNLRLVFASSGGTVYGAPRAELVSEEHPTNPLCSYGITKLAIEKYLLLYRELYGVRSVVLRIANPYGPGQRPDSIQGVIAVFSGRILRGHVVDIWGDGSVVRDYVFVKDVVSAMRAASSYGGRRTVFNIGSGRGFSVSEILSSIESASGKVAEVIHHPPRGFDVQKSVLDISNARAELGWEPRVSLCDGIAQTLAWMKENLYNDSHF